MSAVEKMPKADIPARQSAPSYMELVDRAVAAGQMDLVDRLMTAQERWDAGQARKAYNAAISAAKAEMPVITKNRTANFGAGKASYRHVDLAQIESTIRPVLGKFGLDYRFRTNVADNKIVVTCLVTHKDGHMEENSLPAPADTSGSKNPIQAIGSTVTYLQRYTLMTALGLAAADDDDGHSAGNGGTHGEAVSLQEALWLSDKYEKLNNLQQGALLRIVGVTDKDGLVQNRKTYELAKVKIANVLARMKEAASAPTNS